MDDGEAELFGENAHGWGWEREKQQIVTEMNVTGRYVAAMGSDTRKVAPAPGSESTVMTPP